MKKVLDIGKPLICNTQDYAFPSAALYDNIYYRKWLYNNLMQLQLNSDGMLEYFCNGIVTNPLGVIPVIQRQYVKSSALHDLNVDIISFIRTMIGQGYYYTSSVNEFYIEKRDSYRMINHDHGIMVYGIDDDKEELHVAGYTNKRKFEMQIVKFEDFRKAFCSLSKESGCNCFKYNGAKLEYDIELMKRIINDYTLSRDSSNLFGNRAFDGATYLYGINACKTFLKEYGYLNMRNIHIMYEYSVLMCDRIAFLKDYFPGENLKRISSEYCEIARKKRRFMLKALKLSVRGQVIIPSDLIEEYCIILDEENEILKKTVMMLDGCN